MAEHQTTPEPFEMACREIIRIGAADIPEKQRDAFVDAHWRDILPCVRRGHAAFMEQQNDR